MKHDVEALKARIAELEGQVANWERKEIQRAVCCFENEQRAEKLAAENAALRKVAEAAEDLRKHRCAFAVAALLEALDALPKEDGE